MLLVDREWAEALRPKERHSVRRFDRDLAGLPLRTSGGRAGGEDLPGRGLDGAHRIVEADRGERDVRILGGAGTEDSVPLPLGWDE
jgi:hypothetical protein